MIMDYTTLKVGDIVAVARHGSWDISNQGEYRVVKVNKVKVVVERVSDNYRREFSVRKRSEMGVTASVYHNAFLETVEDQDARMAARAKEAAKRHAWNRVEQAARDKNFAALQQAMVNLESMLDPVPF
jgi:uncharacterized protein YceH (UPF0502 family)